MAVNKRRRLYSPFTSIATCPAISSGSSFMRMRAQSSPIASTARLSKCAIKSLCLLSRRLCSIPRPYRVNKAIDTATPGCTVQKYRASGCFAVGLDKTGFKDSSHKMLLNPHNPPLHLLLQFERQPCRFVSH